MLIMTIVTTVLLLLRVQTRSGHEIGIGPDDVDGDVGETRSCHDTRLSPWMKLGGHYDFHALWCW